MVKGKDDNFDLVDFYTSNWYTFLDAADKARERERRKDELKKIQDAIERDSKT